VEVGVNLEPVEETAAAEMMEMVSNTVVVGEEIVEEEVETVAAAVEITEISSPLVTMDIDIPNVS
jgi:hypothetical protein